MLSRLFLLFAIACGTTAHAFALSLNDVSILFPMPEAIDDLLSPGENAQFFPLAALKQAPPLLFKRPAENLYAHDLRLVAVRLDPCFIEGWAPVACRKQIRLIWQPLEQIGGRWMVEDAAVHSFYDFDEATWSQLIQAWRDLPSANDPNEPLQVNPTLVREGLQGPYARALKELLTTFCTHEQLTRVTVGTVNWAGNTWNFAGFNIVGGSLVPIQIAGLGAATVQTFNTDSAETIEFFGSTSPKPKNMDGWNKIIERSIAARTTLDEKTLRTGLAWSYVFENPALSNPGTVDCVSCHVTQAVRSWGETNFSSWMTSFAPNKFTSPLNLQNTSTTPFMTSHVRAFGYTANEVVIAQRTINETAHVVEELSDAY